MLEKWNAYLADGTMTVDMLIRGEAIPSGLYHLVVEVVVQHYDGSFLFMKRDSRKSSYPNYWEITAGGSALFGESPTEAIQRELFEETGIIATHFELLEKIADPQDACLFYRYYCRVDAEKAAIRLQKGETVDFRWVKKDDLKDFLATKAIVPWQKRLFTTFFR
ncbi:NUDIX hydrolase [Streptococcus plurextorum]|uniref:NUDIX hydrolase n=1 Tax=Streptococcus plurextorum TaxID=456876 RepID=UPI000422A355|nr:NUDIX domain-containing protein [Streptococcus plurextorum]